MRWLGTLTAMLVVGWAIQGSGSVLSFINIPSLVFVLLLGTAVIVACHGGDAVSLLLRTLAGRLKPAEMSRARAVVKTSVASFVAAGWIGAIIGVVQLLSSLDDPTRAGPAAAMALLTALYGYLLAYLGCQPLAARLLSSEPTP